MNFVSAVCYGFFSFFCWVEAAVYSVASIDVSDLLSGDGAAGDGKALSGINEQVKEYGKGGFTIVQNLAIYVVAIMMIVGAIFLAIHAGNPNKREEDKNALLVRFGAAILAFAGLAIIVFAQKIGSMLFQ